VLQFGGGLFGRHNFGAANDGFREAGFRLLAFDARGYGASDHPHEEFTIERWARDRPHLLECPADAVRIVAGFFRAPGVMLIPAAGGVRASVSRCRRGS
jgi:pimeloyl-ACP methyl ester carboxylesterase